MSLQEVRCPGLPDDDPWAVVVRCTKFRPFRRVPTCSACGSEVPSRSHPSENTRSRPEPPTDEARIREMVETIRAGGALSSQMGDPISRLHLAVVRYVNDLGPGDVEAEYKRVVEAME